jgi:hypothetical protein
LQGIQRHSSPRRRLYEPEAVVYYCKPLITKRMNASHTPIG